MAPKKQRIDIPSIHAIMVPIFFLRRRCIIINIVISTDDQFVMPARVMLTSFFLNNPGETHNIYFLHSTIRQENLDALEKLVSDYQSNFIPVSIQESDFDGFKRNAVFPVQVYYRLLLSRYIPETDDRALWLDVDLIVNGSLRELYDLDFEGSYLAGCADVGAIDRSLLFGAPKGTIYVNSGVLLFNTTVMRNYTLADYTRYYKENESKILWNDQDILNGMFAQKIKILDHNVYNAQVWFRPPLPQKIEKTVRQTARIIHYLGHQKPWRISSRHPAGCVWDEYYMLACGKNPVYSTIFCLKHRFMRWMLRVYPAIRSFLSKVYHKLKD